MGFPRLLSFEIVHFTLSNHSLYLRNVDNTLRYCHPRLLSAEHDPPVKPFINDYCRNSRTLIG